MRFNGHPPLGVNATRQRRGGGVMVIRGFNGHPPLGVNATELYGVHRIVVTGVSMGTHPWG